jgi:hypothetical protein
MPDGLQAFEILFAAAVFAFGPGLMAQEKEPGVGALANRCYRRSLRLRQPGMRKRLFIVLLSFERSHINREAILHISLEQPLVSFVHLLDRDDFDIGGDLMCTAKIEHLLGLGNATDR